MQDFEIPRYEQAKCIFAEAFRRGYTRGKIELASGQSQQTCEANSVFYVDVSRHALLDGEGELDAPLFEKAGYDAALAKRRRHDDAELIASEDPDDRKARIRGKCRWLVVLNP